jgi:phosphate transport system permease protein
MIKRKLKNFFFLSALSLSFALVLCPLLLIFGYVLFKGASSVNLDFLIRMPTPVGETGGGMLHAISGTLEILLMGITIAFPIGILSGIYLSEYGSEKIANALRSANDLLSGVPSIVIGIFAYLLIVRTTEGFSALSGAVALSLIMIPIITRSTEEILRLIPDTVREAGMALGLPRYKVTLFIVVRGALRGILTGTMLAVSRAGGETAPLLFTAFGNMYLSFDPLGPMASLPVQIYTYSISPYEDWQRKAWAAALVLIIIVLGINISARLLIGGKRQAVMNLRRFFRPVRIEEKK